MGSLTSIACGMNPPVPDTLYGLNSHPPQHPLYHFLVSPPSLASNAEPHMSPQPEMPFLPTFFMTGSSSFTSPLRCHLLREASQSPLAGWPSLVIHSLVTLCMPFLAHSLKPSWALSCLSARLCHVGSMTAETPLPTCLIYRVIVPALKEHKGIIARDGLLL